MHENVWKRFQRYGIDAPFVPVFLGLSGLIVLVTGLVASRSWWLIGWGGTLLASAFTYLHASLRGKFRVWAAALDRLSWRGDERVLDIGCGRGAVLLAAARRIPHGQAVGVDRWRSGDQLGNRPAQLVANARTLGISIAVVTGDARALPFRDNVFDRVLSSLVIHNIPAKERPLALAEAARVLRPGGEIIILDLGRARTRAYARWLCDIGFVDVTHQGVGWQMWFGGPWVAAFLVYGRKSLASKECTTASHTGERHPSTTHS